MSIIIYSTDILALCTQFKKVVFSIILMWALDNMPSPVSAFVFISGNIFIQKNSSGSCRRNIPYVSSLMDHTAPSGYQQVEIRDSLPVSSDDFLRQRQNNHPFKGRLRAPCSPTTIIWLMSQQSTKCLVAGAGSN